MNTADIDSIRKYIREAMNGKMYIDKNSIEAIKAKTCLQNSLSENICIPEVFNRWLKKECEDKNAGGLESMLELEYTFGLINEESIQILAAIACDGWHWQAENLVSVFEKYPTALTDDILYQMALERYPYQYYSDDDNGSVSRKCVWALWRRGAIDNIRQLSKSGDKIAEVYANHQLQKLDE